MKLMEVCCLDHREVRAKQAKSSKRCFLHLQYMTMRTCPYVRTGFTVGFHMALKLLSVRGAPA